MNKRLFVIIVMVMAVAVGSVIRFLNSENDVKDRYNDLDHARTTAEQAFNRRNELQMERANWLNSEHLDQVASRMQLEQPKLEQTAFQIKTINP